MLKKVEPDLEEMSSKRVLQKSSVMWRRSSLSMSTKEMVHS